MCLRKLAWRICECVEVICVGFLVCFGGARDLLGFSFSYDLALHSTPSCSSRLASPDLLSRPAPSRSCCCPLSAPVGGSTQLQGDEELGLSAARRNWALRTVLCRSRFSSPPFPLSFLLQSGKLREAYLGLHGFFFFLGGLIGCWRDGRTRPSPSPNSCWCSSSSEGRS